MNKTSRLAPQVLHRLPGRIRVHLPWWSGETPEALAGRRRQVPGVRATRANPVTRKVLLHFDPRVIAEADLLAVLGDCGPGPEADPTPEAPAGLGWRDAPPRAGTLCAVVWRPLRPVLPDVLLCAAACAGPFGLPLLPFRHLQRTLDVLSWGSTLGTLLVRAARPPARGLVGRTTWARAA